MKQLRGDDHIGLALAFESFLSALAENGAKIG